MIRTFAAALLALLPVAVQAAAPRCTLPATLPRPEPEGPGAQQPVRRVATASYTLALIWGPEACHRPRSRGAGDLSCSNAWNRRHFTLHGLWPDGAVDGQWPQYCKPVELLTDAQLRAGLCATPSVQLLQHEWAKHGSCFSADPARYIAEETGLFARLRFPAMAALARRRDLTDLAFRRAFAAANPGMRPEMMRLNVDRAGWLEEVWLCLDRERRWARCAGGQGDGAAGARRIRVAAPR